MLRDVPHCRSILMCGMGGLIFSVLFLTLVYPLFCDRVSEVKETKVREYMHDRYGIDDRPASMIGGGSRWNTELSKAVRPDSGAADTVTRDAGAAEAAPDSGRASDAATSGHDGALPPAKRQ